MTNRFNNMLMNVASAVGSAQSGEIISFTGVDENGILVLKDPKESYYVASPNNYFNGTLAADTFRTALTLIAASDLSITAYQNQGVGAFAEIGEKAGKLYHKVMEYGYTHLPESEQEKMASYLD